MIKVNKKIAVCIMTYNRINSLREAITSVLNSSINCYQLIIFNDHSTDGTNEYLDVLKKEKSIIEVRHEKNLGQSRNANYIFENIDCEYFLILHDDDTIEPNLLEEKIKLIESDSDIAIVGSNWNVINENGVKLRTKTYTKITSPVIMTYREYFLHYFDGLNLPWTGMLYRKDKIDDIRFDDFFGIAADAIFLSRLAIGNKVGYIPSALFNYRIHENQISVKRGNFQTNYELWTKIFDFFNDLILKNFNEKIYRKKFNIAKNKTLIYLITICPDFSYFFKILKSKYFVFNVAKPKQWLKLISKFIKLIFKV